MHILHCVDTQVPGQGIIRRGSSSSPSGPLLLRCTAPCVPSRMSTRLSCGRCGTEDGRRPSSRMEGGSLELEGCLRYYSHTCFWREEALKGSTVKGLPLPFLLRGSPPDPVHPTTPLAPCGNNHLLNRWEFSFSAQSHPHFFGEGFD